METTTTKALELDFLMKNGDEPSGLSGGFDPGAD